MAKTMEKLLKAAAFTAFLLPTMVFANTSNTTAQAHAENGKVTVISPRTGIQYTVDNPDNRPITIQAEAIAPANSTNVDRIVASNPALSEQSQQTAKEALLKVK